jgi:hypothetical protein
MLPLKYRMIEVKEYVDESGKSPYAKWHNRLNARAAVNSVKVFL